MSTRAQRRQSASARVGMFASRCLFSQLSKNKVLLHLERSDWFCIIPGGRKYTSDIGSFTIAEGALAGPTINFTSGLNIGGTSKIGDPSYTNVPEPTSAMLMLIGVAGLALKRRRA